MIKASVVYINNAIVFIEIKFKKHVVDLFGNASHKSKSLFYKLETLRQFIKIPLYCCSVTKLILNCFFPNI